MWPRSYPNSNEHGQTDSDPHVSDNLKVRPIDARASRFDGPTDAKTADESEALTVEVVDHLQIKTHPTNAPGQDNTGGTTDELRTRVQGVVKRIWQPRHYGFITPDGGGTDIFFHDSHVVANGFQNLKAGQRVEFLISDTPKGPQAVQLIPLD